MRDEISEAVGILARRYYELEELEKDLDNAKRKAAGLLDEIDGKTDQIEAEKAKLKELLQ
jgi:hypothetical protein